MRPPAFWHGAPDHPAARLLAPVGRIYGGFAAARMDRPGVRAECPVLCLGNFTLGGAGKTPTAIALALMLRDLGRRPVFLSRGYGGALSGPVRVDPARHGWRAVGDEPLLLARHAPAIVARDRVAGARLCVEAGADVIVMDDGLQNPSVGKDLALAVVDAGSGIGNGRPFPAGPLRAPLARHWPHVAGLVLIGAGEPGEAVARRAAERGLPVHRARLEAQGDAFAGRRVLAFAGIGRPEKFFATLREAGAEIAAVRAFPDHHPFRDRDLRRLAADADTLGADLVTTEKDFTRLPDAFAASVRVLPVTLVFSDAWAVRAQISARLSAGVPEAARS